MTGLRLFSAKHHMNILNNIRRLRSIWNPSMFQGWGKRHSYFEGWYYKIISADRKHALAVIPGLSYGNGDNHAFIQVMDGIAKSNHYERFNTTDFHPDHQKFDLSIAGNRFNQNLIDLQLDFLQGQIQIIEPISYPSALWAPGIMGWYSFVPFMQCYHGLVSIHHHLKGALTFHGENIDFTGGKGYIEKDWGSSFPLAWVWTQCNHYDDEEDLSIMASVAHIPWLGSYFIGFLALVYIQGKLKIFTTYTKAKMQLGISDKIVSLKFWDKDSTLTIQANQEEGTDLFAPHNGAMTGKVNESLQAHHQVTFHWKDISLACTGSMAGLEVGGNSRILLEQNGKK
ncbi:MAG: hypothetical protein KDC53_09580 [Saprospiraceae bacterium]|nr:hypothetical protein [Saprospiraceae bacterium]